jgi:hypothetical protein
MGFLMLFLCLGDIAEFNGWFMDFNFGSFGNNGGFGGDLENLGFDDGHFILYINKI